MDNDLLATVIVFMLLYTAFPAVPALISPVLNTGVFRPVIKIIGSGFSSLVETC